MSPINDLARAAADGFIEHLGVTLGPMLPFEREARSGGIARRPHGPTMLVDRGGRSVRESTVEVDRVYFARA